MLAISKVNVHLLQERRFRLSEDALLVLLLLLLEIFYDHVFVFVLSVDVYDLLNGLVSGDNRKCYVGGRDNLRFTESAEHCIWKERERAFIQLHVRSVFVFLRIGMRNPKLLSLVHATQVLAVQLAHVSEDKDNAIIQNDVQIIVLQRRLIHSNPAIGFEVLRTVTLRE